MIRVTRLVRVVRVIEEIRVTAVDYKGYNNMHQFFPDIGEFSTKELLLHHLRQHCYKKLFRNKNY